MKAKGFSGRVITLKLKDADFHAITRSHRLDRPSCLAETLFTESLALLMRALAEGGAPGAAPLAGRRWRLIGTGFSELSEAAGGGEGADLFAAAPTASETRDARVEAAIDAVRAKLGARAIFKGRGLE